MWQKTILIGVPFLVLVLVSACAFSPERAATDAVRQMAVNPAKAVATLHLLQTVPWEQGELVLLAYEDESQSHSPEMSPTIVHQLYLFYVMPVGGTWKVLVSSGTEWGGEIWPPGVFNVGSGVIGQQESELSAVYGQVFDERVTALDVVWGDGEVQRVEVVGDSYLALRAGAHEVVGVQD